ncbi:MAG: hypothetical protein HOM84_07335 [Thiotrichales bacterium]|jgi:hypothetical protein|nr:hypothetical protein [Thiotrichales bacterium]MBT3613778.1 hypothetical protein [Thiotrichales bacterium]MBT3753218.1 hypothetical protein [Thiotrichales bacterium]MBT3837877.1 hypothetical protein [Thiotrichales bacterium]MBT4152070.1 hypothetical protein [Thiotrichales bacterium]
MSKEYLNVAKAAKALGVGRKEIQQKIHDGSLITFEGRVALSDLKSVFPAAASMETTSILERLTKIKDYAYLNRVQTAHIPDSYTLMGQVQRLRMELRLSRDERMEHLQLITQLTSNLQEMQKSCDNRQKELVAGLLNMIAKSKSKTISS